jgi:hypothetical protein
MTRIGNSPSSPDSSSTSQAYETNDTPDTETPNNATESHDATEVSNDTPATETSSSEDFSEYDGANYTPPSSIDLACVHNGRDGVSFMDLVQDACNWQFGDALRDAADVVSGYQDWSGFNQDPSNDVESGASSSNATSSPDASSSSTKDAK